MAEPRTDRFRSEDPADAIHRGASSSDQLARSDPDRLLPQTSASSTAVPDAEGVTGGEASLVSPLDQRSSGDGDVSDPSLVVMSAEGVDGTSTVLADEPSSAQHKYQPPSAFDRFRQGLFADRDHDGDGIDDAFDDSDGDGLTDAEERWLLNTDPSSADTDGDGVNDKVEIDQDGDPTNPNIVPGDDRDRDDIPDATEEEYGYDPENPDTDGDGLRDGYEFRTGTDPDNKDTDGDGILDGDEDQDDDGLTALVEQEQKTRPDKDDTDGDDVMDDGRPLDEFLDQRSDEFHKWDRVRQAEAADPIEVEDAEPDGIVRVANPELANKAGYSALDGRLGKDDFVWNNRTGEVEEGDKLERGSTMDVSGSWRTGHVTAKSSEFGEEVVPLERRGRPGSSEAEGESPYDEGEGEDLMPDTGDLTPEGPEVGRSRIDPNALLSDPGPTGGSSDPMDPAGRDYPMGLFTELGRSAASASNDSPAMAETSPADIGGTTTTQVPVDDAAQQGDTGSGTSGGGVVDAGAEFAGSGSAGSASDDSGGTSDGPSGSADDSSDGEGDQDVEEYTVTTVEGTDSAVIVVTRDGKEVPENEWPPEVQEAVDEERDRLEKEREEQEQAGEHDDRTNGDAGDAEATTSESVETSYDPSTGPIDPAIVGKARVLETELGAESTNPKAGGAVDPAGHQIVESGPIDPARIITTADLARPIADEPTGGPTLRDPENNYTEQSGLGGTGAMDPTPDDLSAPRQGQYLDPGVGEDPVTLDLHDASDSGGESGAEFGRRFDPDLIDQPSVADQIGAPAKELNAEQAMSLIVDPGPTATAPRPSDDENGDGTTSDEKTEADPGNEAFGKGADHSSADAEPAEQTIAIAEEPDELVEIGLVDNGYDDIDPAKAEALGLEPEPDPLGDPVDEVVKTELVTAPADDSKPTDEDGADDLLD
jgi:hypothetical protein